MSLLSLRPNDSTETVNRKIIQARRRYNSRRDGSVQNFTRRMESEWKAWNRQRKERQSRPGPSRSRTPRRTPSPPQGRLRAIPEERSIAFSTAPRSRTVADTRPVSLKILVTNKVNNTSANNSLPIHMYETVGKVLTDLKAYAVRKRPEMFRGFSLSLSCIDFTGGHRVVNRVLITPGVSKNTRLSSLLPNSSSCGIVHMDVIVPSQPSKSPKMIHI